MSEKLYLVRAGEGCDVDHDVVKGMDGVINFYVQEFIGMNHKYDHSLKLDVDQKKELDETIQYLVCEDNWIGGRFRQEIGDVAFFEVTEIEGFGLIYISEEGSEGELCIYKRE